MSRLKELVDRHLKNVDSPESVPRNWKPKKNRMKRILRAIVRTATGENKTGEAIHGFLDLVPFPNQLVAKLVKWSTSTGEEANIEFKKLLSFRNIVSSVIFILLITGVVGIEEARQVLELFFSNL